MRNGARGMPVAFRMQADDAEDEHDPQVAELAALLEGAEEHDHDQAGAEDRERHLGQLGQLGVAQKQRKAPRTLAIAKDQTMRYIRSRCSVTMDGPGWMP